MYLQFPMFYAFLNTEFFYSVLILAPVPVYGSASAVIVKRLNWHFIKDDFSICHKDY